MDFERRTMQLYCLFENQFAEPEEVRGFWFDMAQHESRHYGALALVKGLLDSAPTRTLPAALGLERERVEHLSKLLARLEREARAGVPLKRAFEMALEVEGSEVEDLVLDLLSALKGEAERERAVQLLIHDLGDLSYMIEKYTRDRKLLARVDSLIENEVARLRDQTRGLPQKGAEGRKS